MLHVRYLPPKVLMAVSYCGRQLARKLGKVAPTYHRKEGATPHSGVREHSLQYATRGLMGALGCRLGRGI